MADKCAKKSKRKDKATAEHRTTKHRNRRIAKDAAFKSEKRATLEHRMHQRRKGALARIERRIKALPEGVDGTKRELERLSSIKTKIERSMGFRV